jgi:hypothetical protein
VVELKDFLQRENFCGKLFCNSQTQDEPCDMGLGETSFCFKYVFLIHFFFFSNFFLLYFFPILLIWKFLFLYLNWFSFLYFIFVLFSSEWVWLILQYNFSFFLLNKISYLFHSFLSNVSSKNSPFFFLDFSGIFGFQTLLINKIDKQNDFAAGGGK